MRDIVNWKTRLNVLLSRLVDESITAEEFSELEEILEEYPDAQQRYLHYLGMHVDLQQSKSLDAAPAGSGATGSKVRRITFLAGAAAAIVLAGMFFIQPGPGEQSSIARIVKLSGPIAWTGDGGQMVNSLNAGDLIKGGTLETLAANSWAEIEFLDGSTIWVSGAALLTLSDGEQGKFIHLRRGDLSADVAAQPAGKPLRLMTPSAEAEVLGTQFNVTAGPESTRVSVNEGLVSVERLADGSVQKVPANHLVVAALERESEFKAIPHGVPGFPWSTIEGWQSQFPRDARRGDLQLPVAQYPMRLRAKPCLWTEEGREPDLHYSVNIGVSATSRIPVCLSENARFRVRGRMISSNRVLFGFRGNYLRGGFAGKYFTWRDGDVSGHPDGNFELDIEVAKMTPDRNYFPASPVGLELFDCWALTHEVTAGLEIISVELIGTE
jgi:hypothetical protein